MIKKKLIILLLPLAVMLSLSACSLLDGSAAEQSQAEAVSGQAEAAGSPDLPAEAAEAARPETTQSTAGKAVKVTLYFPTEDNSALKAEEREIRVIDGAILKAMVEALLEGPETAGLHSAIPAGTRLIGINLKEKVAIVDFSKEFASADEIAGTAERLSLANTLTGITGVERVRIHVAGEELTGPDGLAMGDINPAELDENGAPVPEGN